ncbi:MAG: hypothetical protein ACK4NS_07145 [Saprospiraceae bacterium]
MKHFLYLSLTLATLTLNAQTKTLKVSVNTPTGFGIYETKVSLLVNGVQIAEEMTDAAGFCAFTVGNPSPQDVYLVRFDKSDDPLIGVNVRDIMAVRRHLIAGNSPISPYALLAGDVNGSGGVTTPDLNQMRQVIIGEKATFDKQIWTFLPADLAFANPLSPWDIDPESISFEIDMQADEPQFNALGIKAGDVNQSARVNPTMSDQDDPSTIGDYQIAYSAGGADLIKKGQVATFTFSATEPAFYGQWAIDFSDWEVLDVNLAQAVSAGFEIGSHADTNGKLRMLFAGSASDQPLQFSVTARALKTQGLKNLHLSDAIPAMAGNMANQHFVVKLVGN